MDWSNGARGGLSYWLQELLTEVVEKTEASRTEVHRRCNLSDTSSLLVPFPLFPQQLQFLNTLECQTSYFYNSLDTRAKLKII